MNRISAEAIRALPKVELHLHLDASVQPHSVGELCAEIGVSLPDDLGDALICPPVCQDLADYLHRIDLALCALQTAPGLKRASYELVADLARENVIYAEIRYAPQLCVQRGLWMQQAIDAVTAGLRAGEEAFGVRTGQILCCLRHDPPELSHEVVQRAIANWQPGRVVGVDLAADEANYLGSRDRSAFGSAQGVGMPRTVHAGEVAGANSIWEAIDLLGAQRLGHGVHLEDDPALFLPVRERCIALEMCPSSNVRTRAVSSLPEHPIDRYLRLNLPVTVNTDGRTTSNTTLTQEYWKLVVQFGWGLEEIQRTVRTAAASAFLDDEERAKLLQIIDQQWPSP